MKVSVITISDRAAAGEYEDMSGREIEALVCGRYADADVRREVVSDESEHIAKALAAHADADYIFTTGGTGIGPRDVTPEVTRTFCERELPGVAEALRAESLKQTPFAMLSRGYAGVKGYTIVVNFPGSPKAARMCTMVLLPVMEHGTRMVLGEGHRQADA